MASKVTMAQRIKQILILLPLFLVLGTATAQKANKFNRNPEKSQKQAEKTKARQRKKKWASTCRRPKHNSRNDWKIGFYCR